MKAFPIIYSRTKNCDFVPDFLVRPEDFDYQTAIKYVNSAMKELDFCSEIRYAVFGVGEYSVCCGIACITDILAKKVGKEADDYEYTRDIGGRRMQAFIGFAFKKTDITLDEIPCITLEQYWNVYLKYLKEQWLTPVTKSTRACSMEIDSKPYIPQKYLNNFHSKGTKKYVLQDDFKNNSQDILDYYIYSCMHNRGDSFLSGINRNEHFYDNYFQSLSVSESVAPSINSELNEPSVTPPNISQFEKTNSTAKPFSRYDQIAQINNISTRNDTTQLPIQQKKNPQRKNLVLLGGEITVLAVMAIIVVLLILLLEKMEISQ